MRGNADPRVDEFIKRSEPFAQPILHHLRKLVHDVCPDVEETIKWGMPFFAYKGPLCNMAAFKHHCAFGFWKEALIPEIKKIQEDKEYAMGSLGRITSLSDSPSDAVLKRLIKAAILLNETGVRMEKKTSKEKEKELVVPDYLIGEIRKHKKALATWEAFSYSHKKEYVEWVSGAKTDVTRRRRLSKTIEQLAQGKSQNWKYEKK